jgi:hypothetical protein
LVIAAVVAPEIAVPALIGASIVVGELGVATGVVATYFCG